MSDSWQYYDGLLLAIALRLGVGAAIGPVPAIDLTVAAAVSGGAGLLLIGHGPFVNGPVDSPGVLPEPADALH